MKIENKVVPSYASTNAESKERRHVYLLDLYMEKVPKGSLVSRPPRKIGKGAWQRFRTFSVDRYRFKF